MDDVKHHSPNGGERDYRVAATNPWASAWKMAAAAAAVGLCASIAGYMIDPARFAFSYLLGFICVLTMALGSLFFVLVQHLTSAGWSVTVRRVSELFAAGMIVVPLLWLPNLLSLHTLYPWWSHGREAAVAHAQEHAAPSHTSAVVHHVGGEASEASEHASPEHAAHERTIAEKLPYLNSTFFFIRAIGYMLIWLWLTQRFFGYSTAQDRDRDPQWTVKLQRLAPGATFLFALTLTFAGFDWVMSLEPTWYSTMFGVRIFASSVVLGLALNTLVSLGLKRSGVVRDEISVHHFHDLGKLMFAFLVFWAYISFCEFMLIWYAAIPEETTYYHHRWDLPMWRTISISIVVVKFIIPFFLIMSRNAKRNLGMLGLGAGWIVSMHLVEMYYWIMPYAGTGDVPLTPTGLMTDIGCVLTCVGIYLAVVFYRMLNHPVIPVGDPRLSRALNFVNA